MMNPLWTPPPWVVSHSFPEDWHIVEDATGNWIADFTTYTSRPKANAQLAAASPELYEALERAAKNKVVNNWTTGGVDVCLVCGELVAGKHDEECWVPAANLALAKARGAP